VQRELEGPRSGAVPALAVRRVNCAVRRSTSLYLEDLKRGGICLVTLCVDDEEPVP